MKQPVRIVLCLLLLLLPLSVQARTTHEVFFRGSDHELDVYHIEGHEAGPTLMILGGIQGDEPGGYLAADLYADMSLKKGNLIVVPRANFYSILVNNRGPNGDMNRKFAGVPSVDPDSAVVIKIKELMAEADYFLNLHDGSGYFRPEYEDDMHSPRRFGQCVIADTYTYELPDGTVLDLGEMAERVVARVNGAVEDPEHKYHFNNHRTSSSASIHKEQRKSATYYVLTKLHKPAFASETSKNIRDFRQRVVYQTMVVNAFMQEIGIVPEQPSLSIEPPHMDYALVSVNGAHPMAVHDGQHLVITPGDMVAVTGISANYRRGLVADIKGCGHLNDLGTAYAVNSSTSIEVRKDMFPCGRIHLDVAPANQRTWLVLEADGRRFALAPDEHLRLQRGATLVIRDLIYRGSGDHGFIVNFKGFVSDWKDNTGEDRGSAIDTTNLLARYGENDGNGSVSYRIAAMRGHSAVANFYVDLED